MKGICFKELLFHAAVNGTKTQTRRIVKPKPDYLYNGLPFYGISLTRRPNYSLHRFGTTYELLPKYNVGEKVYLKEPYVIDLNGSITYKYGNNSGFAFQCPKWGNKLFMPEKYARYFIEIKGVRCERLQDISDEDCLKEGIEELNAGAPEAPF